MNIREAKKDPNEEKLYLVSTKLSICANYTGTKLEVKKKAVDDLIAALGNGKVYMYDETGELIEWEFLSYSAVEIEE